MMTKAFSFLLGTLISIPLIVGCASNTAKSYLNKPIEEAYFELGPPENIIDLNNGKKAFQHRWGGGSYVIPGRSKSKITGTNYGATVSTISTPAQVIESAGCLITLIAEEKEPNEWVVTDWRIPKRLVC